MADSASLVKYDEELFKAIQVIFINKIVPENFILVVHKYNSNVLTHRDIEELQKATDHKAAKDVNFKLLSKMKSYKGWFEVILQVCEDPDVKQGFLVGAFQEIKRELDEKWNNNHQTQCKELDTGLANVTLKSRSNQGTMGRQLSSDGVLETDSAVCMSSESRQQEDKNREQLLTEDNSGSTHRPSWEGWTLTNGKPYCDICHTPLTSEKAAEDHFKGKPHKKKLKEVKEAISSSQEWPKTDIAMAAISQATTTNVKSTPPRFQPNPVSDKTVVSPGSSEPAFGHKMIAESLKSLYYRDRGNAKKLPLEGQSVTANTPCWGGLIMKNGSQFCDLCQTFLTSPAVADAHCKGKQHEKNLNKAFPTGQSAFEASCAPVSVFQASSSSMTVSASLGLSGGCETAVSSAPVSDCKGATADFKTTSFNDKKISTSLSTTKATPAGAMKASPTSSIVTLASVATVVTPTNATGLNQASVRDEDYIVVNKDGTLQCKLCRAPVTSGVSASQHLQGGKHKKKLEALRVQDVCHEDRPELGPNGEVIILQNDGSGKCYVCNAPVNSEESAKQHMEGRKHINQCKRYGLPANVNI